MTWKGSYYRGLLFSRFLLFNALAFAGVGYAYLHGWAQAVIQADTSYICAAISALFLYTLFQCGVRTFQVASALDHLPDGWGSRLSLRAEAARLSSRVRPVFEMANVLAYLGLIGTVLGFIIALSGIKPDAAADASATREMISTLISGMSVALYTTLVGGLGYLWLRRNATLLAEGVARLQRAVEWEDE